MGEAVGRKNVNLSPHEYSFSQSGYTCTGMVVAVHFFC